MASPQAIQAVQAARPGWYQQQGFPLGHERYWSGQWWMQSRVLPTKIVGPNHVLHFMLTFLTWWFFGGWGWVWLWAAICNDQKEVLVPPPGTRW